MSGAQRLAASQEKSPDPVFAKKSLCVVLNASRHHRKNRGRHKRFQYRARGAQRLAASQEKSLGVVGAITLFSIVLNASRHHRKNRRRNIWLVTKSPACSTPRGITGKIARHC